MVNIYIFENLVAFMNSCNIFGYFYINMKIYKKIEIKII